MNKFWKILAFISRILIGALFVFSGYVKAVDPLGFKYKLGEYLTNMHLGFFEPISLLLAILIIAAELTMGLCLLARVRMKLISWCVLLFMLFFTALTLYIAVAGDVVQDCGCFGDALILSNWATFWKNVIAMIFVLIIFYWRKHYTPIAKPIFEWIILIIFYAASASISLYCLKHLPIIDFMAYKTGTNIPNSMIIPEGAPTPKYKTIYFYSKNGETKEFNDTNYPWQDSTWTFVDSKSTLIEKGYEPPIHDFIITTLDGNDITNEIINNNNFIFILTSKKVEEADITEINKIKAIAKYSQTADTNSYFTETPQYNFFCYTASNDDAINNFAASNNITFPFCIGDETTIKSIVRSNPGLIMIKDGNIYGKWAHADIPSIEQIKEIQSTDLSTLVKNARTKEKQTTIILAIIALIIVVPLNFLRYKK